MSSDWNRLGSDRWFVGDGGMFMFAAGVVLSRDIVEVGDDRIDTDLGGGSSTNFVFCQNSKIMLNVYNNKLKLHHYKRN